LPFTGAEIMGFNFILGTSERCLLAVFYTFGTGKTRIATTLRTIGYSPCERHYSHRYSAVIHRFALFSPLFLAQILDTGPIERAES